ncbi:hypothetical protein SAMN05216548_105214 [Faunimonas pinastri]|uniref:Uncharacterized protein n=1 Tax=Faunimonas pinastri TaxID=1855383 RepID=A0A1H9H182_9HYPH|nr:hypothetical protein [Faunimonas pinastri]SEQ56091.1 hypothetical protein SAMN05216548_105214 [Faunimonas pinastri]
MVTVLRIVFLLPLGFVVACLAGAVFLVVAVLHGSVDDVGAYTSEYGGQLLLLTLGLAASIGWLAAVPSLIGALLGEIFAWRSVLFYLVYGGLTGLVSELAIRSPEAAAAQVHIFVGAGCVGGLFYWIVAGSTAGAGRVKRVSKT